MWKQLALSLKDPLNEQSNIIIFDDDIIREGQC